MNKVRHFKTELPRMFFMQYAAFLVIFLHQSIVNGFNLFNLDIGFNYRNRDIDSIWPVPCSTKPQWFLQEIDHFNSSDKRKWQMQYFEELRYWRENGPIYLFLGDSIFVDSCFLISGLPNDLIQETNGASYFIEHRYYGDSRPFINLKVENMQYLSSRQALADTANFITFLKSLPMFRNSKVVLLGGAYGGNLAAWMKVLYPKLIDAAISSSAPVLAKKDFYEFFEKVKDDYEQYGGKKCVNDIEKLFENYDVLLQSPEGIKQLKQEENICDGSDMTVLENQQLFFLHRTYMFMSSSTYEGQYFIKMDCKNLDTITDYRTVLNKYSNVNDSKGLPCVNYDFNQTITDIQDLRNLDNTYPWLYQTCTEFGHFKTTSSKNQPFLNIPLEFYIKICSALFGNNFNEKRVDKGVEISNKLYGGLKPNVTKVIFTNGDMDPFSKLSILEDLSEDAQAVVIPGVPLCRDMFDFIGPSSDEVIKSRGYVKFLIKKWIGAK